MKKLILSGLCAILFTNIQAQTPIYDSVEIGTANEIWYSLPNDNQGTQPRANWDLAFEADTYGVSILFNTAGGNTVYVAPGATIPAFSTTDTTGITSWTPLYNSDTAWEIGALNTPSTGGLDYGWGDYNTVTHNLTGTRVFVVKYTAGTYKKFYIQELNTTTGEYVLVFANLDNTGLTTVTIDKTPYNTKNFVYYSLSTATLIDREPVSAGWDLLFTKYTGFVPTAYTVTGVLHNKGITVAEATGIANTATYVNYSAHTFETAINTIGYDWKTFTGSSYAITDSMIYFVHANDSQFWKLIFTGYGSNKFNFNKTQLTSTGISTEENNLTLSVYPNPASNNENVTVLLNAENATNSIIRIIDISGRIVNESNQQLNAGINQIPVAVTSIESGMYIVSVSIDNSVLTQKLIINK